MKHIAILSIMAACLCGCNSTHRVGQVGDVEYYKIHLGNFSGPHVSALVSKSKGVVRVEASTLR